MNLFATKTDLKNFTKRTNVLKVTWTSEYAIF